MAKQTVKILPIELGKVNVTIEGLSPLLVCRKSLESLLETTKDEDKLYKNCFYPSMNGNHTFTGAAIKKCMVGAANTFFKGVTKKQVTGGVIIPYEYIEIIEASEPRKRIDIGRNKNRELIKLVRAEFEKWKMNFDVEFDTKTFTVERVLNLLNTAGSFQGVGCWRPSCDGMFGRFTIVSTD